MNRTTNDCSPSRFSVFPLFSHSNLSWQPLKLMAVTCYLLAGSGNLQAATDEDADSILLKREPDRCAAATITLPEVIAAKRPKLVDPDEEKDSDSPISALKSMFDKGELGGAVTLSDGEEVIDGNATDDTMLSADQEIAIEGDEFAASEGNVIVVRGKAQITQGVRGLFAEEIEYDRESYMADAHGDVSFYTIGGDVIKTDSMRLEVDTFIGEAGKSEMYIAQRDLPATKRRKNYLEDYTFFAPLTNRVKPDYADIKAEEKNNTVRASTRLYADHIDIEDANFQRLSNANMTRCPEGSQDVEIRGKEVELDHGTGIADVTGAQIRFKGVPIFYAPRLSLPLGTQRKSGFLIPSIGDDDINGMTVAVPYYFNLAPNYDATLTPIWYAERGSQLYGEFRMLGHYSDGQAKFEYMPEDALFENEPRHAVGMKYKLDLPSGFGARVDLQDVSDTEYLDDFNNEVEVTSTTYLPQTGETFFRNDLLDATARLQKYELVDETLKDSRPYDLMPQLTLNLHPDEVGLFEFGLDSEYTQFDHAQADKLSGTRLNWKPWLSTPYEPVWGFIKPKLSLRNVSYNLDNVANDGETSPSASVPIFSVDNGLFFERDVVWNDTQYLHTLEPRVMYVNAPAENQDDIPNFDTSEGASSSYSYLFREDRFFGGDRIGDDHHIAFGVSSAIIGDTDGKERLKASIGQMYYLDDREISASGENKILEDEKSDIFGELTANLTDDFSANSAVQWDHEDFEVNSFTLGLSYDDTFRRKVALDYSFSASEVEDVEDSKSAHLNLSWPITDRIQVGTEQRYDITKGEITSSQYSLTYDACCWAIGLVTQSTLQDDGDYRESILATFELAGIGRMQTDGSNKTGQDQ